jgi:ribonuclease P protein component
MTSRTWERSARTPYFLLRTRKSEARRKHIAVVVAKAVHKSAVKRNFLKRQAKAALHGVSENGADLLLTVSPSARTLTKKAFRAEVLKVAKTLRGKEK